MTEKRFTFEVKIRGNTAYIQWYDDGKPINSAETIVELLNELHEENQRLKKENKKLKIFKETCDTPNWKTYLKAEGLE